MQAMLHQERVVHSRDDGENEGRAQEYSGCDVDHDKRFNQEQKHEKDRPQLRARVGLPKNAGPEIPERNRSI